MAAAASALKVSCKDDDDDDHHDDDEDDNLVNLIQLGKSSFSKTVLGRTNERTKNDDRKTR